MVLVTMDEHTARREPTGGQRTSHSWSLPSICSSRRLLFGYIVALQGGNAPGLGWEEIIKKRFQKSIPILKALVWGLLLGRNDSLPLPPDMAQ